LQHQGNRQMRTMAVLIGLKRSKQDQISQTMATAIWKKASQM